MSIANAVRLAYDYSMSNELPSCETQGPAHIPFLAGYTTLQLWVTPEQAAEIAAEWERARLADLELSERLAKEWA